MKLIAQAYESTSSNPGISPSGTSVRANTSSLEATYTVSLAGVIFPLPVFHLFSRQLQLTKCNGRHIAMIPHHRFSHYRRAGALAVRTSNGRCIANRSRDRRLTSVCKRHNHTDHVPRIGQGTTDKTTIFEVVPSRPS